MSCASEPTIGDVLIVLSAVEARVTGTMDALCAQVQGSTSAIDALRTEMDALRGDVRGEVQGNTSAINALRTETDALRGQIDALRTEIAALGTQMEANTASILSDVARQTATAMQRMDTMEQRLTQALTDVGLNWNHAARIECKVENLRDETRLGDQSVHEIMRMVRAMEERITRLERGRP